MNIFTKLSVVIALSAAACSADDRIKRASESGRNSDLGIVPIGSVPVELDKFKVTDCSEAQGGFNDCSAIDDVGRRYAFFDGALSMVSVEGEEVSSGFILPAGMKFGERIEDAAEKAAAWFRVEFNGGSVEGVAAYSSKMKVKSSAGILYSIELIANKEGRLAKVVQRTDY